MPTPTMSEIEASLDGADVTLSRRQLHKMLSQGYIDGRNHHDDERRGIRGMWEGGYFYAARIISQILSPHSEGSKE